MIYDYKVLWIIWVRSEALMNEIINQFIDYLMQN